MGSNPYEPPKTEPPRAESKNDGQALVVADRERDLLVAFALGCGLSLIGFAFSPVLTQLGQSALSPGPLLADMMNFAPPFLFGYATFRLGQSSKDPYRWVLALSAAIPCVGLIPMLVTAVRARNHVRTTGEPRGLQSGSSE